MRKKLLLIEMFVMVLLLSIMGIIFVPKFLSSQETAKISLAKYELGLLDKGMKQYYQDHGSYLPRNGGMTSPNLYSELIVGNYVDKNKLKDPFIGPDELTNDGNPSIYFWGSISGFELKYAHYNTTTNQYRGNLPGLYLYNIGSSGPDKVINLDNPPYGRTSILSANPVSIRAVTINAVTGTIINRGTIQEIVTVIPGGVITESPAQNPSATLPNSNAVITINTYADFDSQSQIIETNLGMFQLFIDYDPTNGLHSGGDIHLLGPE